MVIYLFISALAFDCFVLFTFDTRVWIASASEFMRQGTHSGRRIRSEEHFNAVFGELSELIVCVCSFG